MMKYVICPMPGPGVPAVAGGRRGVGARGGDARLALRPGPRPQPVQGLTSWLFAPLYVYVLCVTVFVSIIMYVSYV